MATDMDSSSLCGSLSSPPDSPPSSPLTVFSTSPSPPPADYFTDISYLPSPPASQQTSHTGSPTPDGIDSGTNTDKEGPPTKKRRISRERTTETLDLRSGEVSAEQQEQLDRLLHVLHKRQKIVVIAGAGMSVAAGIPDFRSSHGLFRSLKHEHKLKGSGKHLFDASVYKDDSATSSFHDMVSSMSRLTRQASPTAFHHMLATIAKEDRLLRLYSQNVDGIDTSLEPLSTAVPLRKDESGKWPRTVQLHGGLSKMVCTKCHELSEFDAQLFSGPTAPLCPRCEEIDDIRTMHEGKRSHGIGKLRPRMVLYNEHNPDDIAIGSVTRDDLRRRPDAVIVVGTTLKVPGVRRIVREMCSVVRNRRDGEAIWINNDLPPVSKDLEDCFDIIVQSPCDEVAKRAAMRKWDDPMEQEAYREVSDEVAQKAREKAAEVHLPSSQDQEAHSHDVPAYAEAKPLSFSDHLNNSFLASVVRTPSKRPLASPEDWSPITVSRPKVLPSIEKPAFAHPATVSGPGAGTALSTTPKSAIAKSSFMDKIINRTNRGSAPAKVGRPPKAKALSKTKPKPKAPAATKGGARLDFKATKASAIVARADHKGLPAKVSELYHVFSASVEPMHPLSPNTTPQKQDLAPADSDSVRKQEKGQEFVGVSAGIGLAGFAH